MKEEKKIQLATEVSDDAETKDQTCICFCCAHSMVFIRAVPRPQINKLSQRMETKMEARDQAVCVRWPGPMLIGTDVEVQFCTEFELGPVKTLKSPGGLPPSNLLQ